jgi:hypothetical protein
MKKLILLLLTLFAWNCRDNSNNITSSVVDTSIDDPYSTPHVIWTDPLAGAVGPNIMSPGNVVKIRFDKLMDSKSVVRAVTLSPSSEWVYIDTTRSGPVEGTTFDFPLTPEPNYLPIVMDAKLDARFPPWYVIQYPYFKVGQTYTISVAASASDIFGNTLEVPDSFSFMPEPYFRVTDTTPLDNDTAVAPLATIAVRFNALIDTSSVHTAFSISPTVSAASSSYYGSWGFYWSPSPMFAPETQYTVTIGTQAKDVDGHQLPSPFVFSFTTAPYSVTGSTPIGSGIPRNATIGIYCNFFVDSANAVTAFHSVPLIAGAFQISGTSFYVTPSSPLSPQTTYTVTISNSLKGTNGFAMKSPYSFSFTTGN